MAALGTVVGARRAVRLRGDSPTIAWAVAGLAVATYAVLREADALLGRIAGVDGRGFDAGVFIGLKLRVHDTTDLAAAMELWTDPASPDAAVATRILQFHVVTDLVFIAAYTYLLWRVLRWVGVGPTFALRAPLVMAAADWAETTLFGVAVATRSTRAVVLAPVQFFALIKWATLITIVLAIVVAFGRARGPTNRRRRSEDPGRVNRDTVGAAIGEWRRNERVPVPLAIVGQLVLVGAFAILVGAPGGSVLSQVPDVLRAQIDPLTPGAADGDATPLVLSMVALGIFAIAATTSAAIGGAAPTTSPRTIGSAIPLAIAFVISGFLALAALLVDGTTRLSAWSSLVVVGAVAFAAWIAARSGRDLPAPRNASHGGVVRSASPPEQDAVVTDQGLSGWAAALGAVIIMAGGVGLIRAGAPFVLLGTSTVTWAVIVALGFVTVVVVGTATHYALSHRLVVAVLASPTRRRGFVLAVAVVVAFLAAQLAIRPALAANWGTTGTVAIAFSAYTLVIGALQRLARITPLWRATQRLGLGPRTPYTLLLLAVWATGSFLDTDPGYHEIPTIEQTATSTAGSGRYDSVGAAFDTWVETNATADCGTDPGGTQGDADTIPLVLVAAPGGGIRAAYWTGSTLEALLPGECRHRLFAASGSSGGAVGISVWSSTRSSMAMAASDATDGGGDDDGDSVGASAVVDPDPDDGAITGDQPALDALRAMSRDRALAATVAALLLRDAPQPLLGLHSAWTDRAVALEEAWITSTEAATPGGVAPFGTVERPRPLADLGPAADPDGWVPLVVLNSASVLDGCRVLLTNVGGLPIRGDGDCLATDPANLPGPIADGTSRVAVDPLPLLTDDDACATDRPPLDISIGSAALASARFPYVTPSGSLRICVDRGGPDGPAASDLYLVDGGYFENTGLLAILEIWLELEDRITEHNAEGGPQIEPWILFLDSGYRSDAPIPAASRPLELVVPLEALLSNGVIGSSALEQRAALAMATFGDREVDRADCHPHYARIGPSQRAEVSAPLGWVLSGASQRSLDAFRDEVLAVGDPAPDPDPDPDPEPLYGPDELDAEAMEQAEATRSCVADLLDQLQAPGAEREMDP